MINAVQKGMEYEIRFYYPSKEYNKKLEQLRKIKDLNYNGRKHEITSQFDHPNKEYSFYTKEVDGRFRIRKTEGQNDNKCMISWKRRLNKIKSIRVCALNSENRTLSGILQYLLRRRSSRWMIWMSSAMI